MPRRILLCDDCDGYRFLERAVLESAGAEIVGEASDGLECLRIVGEADADVILLDVNMSPVGGFEILPELRRRVPSTQVIVLSTGSPAELERRSLELGALAFVQKPANIFAVPRLVDRVLAPRAGRDEQRVPAPSEPARGFTVVHARRSMPRLRPAAL